MQGYNDKMAVLARDVLEKAKGLVIDPRRLEVMKEQVSVCPPPLPSSAAHHNSVKRPKGVGRTSS